MLFTQVCIAHLFYKWYLYWNIVTLTPIIGYGVKCHFQQYFSYNYHGGEVLLVEEIRVPGENHRPVTSH